MLRLIKKLFNLIFKRDQGVTDNQINNVQEEATRNQNTVELNTSDEIVFTTNSSKEVEPEYIRKLREIKEKI